MHTSSMHDEYMSESQEQKTKCRLRKFDMRRDVEARLGYGTGFADIQEPVDACNSISAKLGIPAPCQFPGGSNTAKFFVCKHTYKACQTAKKAWQKVADNAGTGRREEGVRRNPALPLVFQLPSFPVSQFHTIPVWQFPSFPVSQLHAVQVSQFPSFLVSKFHMVPVLRITSVVSLHRQPRRTRENKRLRSCKSYVTGPTYVDSALVFKHCRSVSWQWGRYVHLCPTAAVCSRVLCHALGLTNACR